MGYTLEQIAEMLRQPGYDDAAVYEAISQLEPRTVAAPESPRKYELTDDTIEWYGFTLHRIRALRTLEDSDGDVIAAGDTGGYVQAEANLDHEGDAWVSGDARVYGDARVSGDAWVYGGARVAGNARVYDNARVSGGAWVFGDAQVSGDAQVFGGAQVSGGAWVFGGARVFGGAWVFGDARVFGDAQVSGGLFA